MLLPSFTPRAIGIEIQAHSIGLALLRKTRKGTVVIRATHTEFTDPEQNMLTQPELIEKNLPEALSQFGRHGSSPMCCVINIPAAHTFYERIALPANVMTSADTANYAQEQANHLLPLPPELRLDDWTTITPTHELALVGASLSWANKTQDILSRLQLICVAAEPDIIAFHRSLAASLTTPGIILALTALEDQFLVLAADQNAPIAFMVTKKEPAEMIINLNSLIRFVEAKRRMTPATILLAMSKQAGESLSEQLKQLPMQKQILSTTTAPTANKDAVSPILFGLASRGLELRSFFVSGKS